jgi:hypothetical protein
MKSTTYRDPAATRMGQGRKDEQHRSQLAVGGLVRTEQQHPKLNNNSWSPPGHEGRIPLWKAEPSGFLLQGRTLATLPRGPSSLSPNHG